MVSLVLHAFAASGSGCAGRPRFPAAAHTNTEYSIHQIDALRNEKHPSGWAPPGTGQPTAGGPHGAACAVIGLFGDDPNDDMAKCGAKWLHKNGVNALCMSPGKHNYSHVNCPLEKIETAIQWLMAHGNRKVGIIGKLILIGADDDSLWEAGKYVRRMDQRLQKHPHECDYEAVTYPHGTHFVLPESMLRMALPIGLKFVMRFLFRSAKQYPDACEAARNDIDKRLSAALQEWIAV